MKTETDATAAADAPAPKWTIEDVQRRVAALLKLAERAGTPEEAQAAAAKASALMTTYEITREAALADSCEREAVDEAIADLGEDGKGAGAIPMNDDGTPTEQIKHWKLTLAAVVAHAHGCHAYTGYDLGEHRPDVDWSAPKWECYTGRGRTIAFIGRPSDVSAVRYVFLYLTEQCRRLCEERGRGKGRTWRNNFRLGFAVATRDRLAHEREKVYEKMREDARAASAAGNPRALVRVENAIERIAKRADEAEAWADSHMRLVSTHGSGRLNSDGLTAGRDAAETVVMKRARGALGEGNEDNE